MRITVPSFTVLAPLIIACSLGSCGSGLERRQQVHDSPTPFFASEQRAVVTFVGYSDSGYEDQPAMLRHAEEILGNYNPARTIVNIGATPGGIGAVYELAKKRGFTTTGIVSSQARVHEVSPSKYVDHIFYINDETWGGTLEGTQKLSPTSAAMVKFSDVVIGIGGGEVARVELLAARVAGKKVRFIPAEMNHANAIAKAKRKNQPPPHDFAGAASHAF